MSESAKIKQAKESFKQYLFEALQGKSAIMVGIDKNIYLTGVIGIVLEVTKGMLPLFIGRTVAELVNITNVLRESGGDYLKIFDNKHNITDDEPRDEQLVFDWEVKNGDILVTSSYHLVGKIRHRGLPL